MEDRDAHGPGVARDVGPVPVLAVVGVVDVELEVGRRLLQEIVPVGDREVLVPLSPQRAREVCSLLDVGVHHLEQIAAPGPLKGVAPLENGIGHHPAPHRRAASVVDPAGVDV